MQLAVGRDHAVLATRRSSETKRQRVSLMPMVQSLAQDEGLAPDALEAVFVSQGPGSFTGLRVAMAACQAIAITNPAIRLVPVATVEVLAQNIPAEFSASPVLVGLNSKGASMYGCVYQHGKATCPAALRDWTQWQSLDVPPEMILAQQVPEGYARPRLTCSSRPDASDRDSRAGASPAANTAQDLTVPWAQHVYQLGCVKLAAGQDCPPSELLPIYARQPEAVTLWEARQSGA